MSVAAINWAFQQIEERRLSRAASLVLLALAQRHHQRTGRCDPSNSTIARMTNLSRRSVITATSSLDESGIISVVHRSTKKGRISNQFFLGGGEATSLTQSEDGGTLGGGEATSPNRVYKNTKGRYGEKSDGFALKIVGGIEADISRRAEKGGA